MYVLGLAGSPRRGGNSELLLDQALAGSASVGADTEKLVLSELSIRPCQSCGGCDVTGMCVLQDDGLEVLSKIRQADYLILASPIYFMGLSAQAKAMIDRCQAQWVTRYRLKQRHMYTAEGQRRRALFIAVAAMRGEKVFKGALITAKAFFATFDFAFDGALLFNGIEERGAILSHPDALRQAFDAGVRLVRAGNAASPPSAQ